MAPEARPRKRNTTKPIALEAREWQSVRELWDLASRAEIDLERSGKPVSPDAVWARLRPHAPESLRFEPKMPAEIKDMLAHEGYRQLLDLRKRMLVIPVLKEYGLLQELTGQMSYLAMISLMEDLLVRPGSIPVNEKRQLAKTFLDVNLQLKGLTPVEDDNVTLGDIAAEEQRERDNALAAIPEPYRELMGKRWDEERLKSLRTRQALHTSEVNKQMGHGKAV